jgi:hypothetical protein
MKFNENPSGGRRCVPCGQTDRHDETNSRFKQCSERVYMTRKFRAQTSLTICFWLFCAIKHYAAAAVWLLRSVSCLQNCRVSLLSGHLPTKRLYSYVLVGRLRYFKRPPYHAGLINGSKGPVNSMRSLSDTPTGLRSVWTAAPHFTYGCILSSPVL